MPSPMNPTFISFPPLLFAVPLQDVEAGVVVGNIDQAVLGHEEIRRVPDFCATSQRLHPFSWLRRDEVTNFLGAVLVGDVEHADTGALPGGENGCRLLESSRAVFVQIMRAELPAQLDVVLVRRGRHRCNRNGI